MNIKYQIVYALHTVALESNQREMLPRNPVCGLLKELIIKIVSLWENVNPEAMVMYSSGQQE